MGDLPLLREAAREWQLFAALLDTAQMSLAKASRRLAALCLELGRRPDPTERVLSELDLTRQWLLDVLEQDDLLEREPALRDAWRCSRPT